MATFLASLTVNPATGATTTWTTIMASESPTAIRSMMLNNGTGEFIVCRRKSNTNVSTQFGTGTFNLPRVNPGDLEVRAAGTNSASIFICCGCPENPA